MTRGRKPKKKKAIPFKITKPIPAEIVEADQHLIRVLFNSQTSLAVRLSAARRAKLLWEKYRQEIPSE